MTELDPAPPQRGDLGRLIRTLADERGLDLGRYARSHLERRLVVRMRVLGVATFGQYAERLERDPDEIGRLAQALAISVTDFFRDPEMWDELRADVVPAILARKTRHRGHTVRVWSAGCATGEEAYSLAMVFLDALGQTTGEFTLEVHGTDLDSDALEVAGRAEYSVARLAMVPPQYLERFFEPPVDETSARRVRSDVRRLVGLQSYSLFKSPPMTLVDLVMCRNVLIYLNREEQTKALDKFWGAMMNGGYLVLGRSEKLPAGDVARFMTVDSKERIFRKVS